jgi:hypothetical protein
MTTKIEKNDIVTLKALEPGYFRVKEVIPRIDAKDKRKKISPLINVERILTGEGDIPKTSYTDRCDISHAEKVTKEMVETIYLEEKTKLENKRKQLLELI